jgi:hypothetical protein
MSLKWFHLVFITLSVALTVVVAAWAIDQARWGLAGLALAGGTALVVYRGAFLRLAERLRL